MSVQDHPEPMEPPAFLTPDGDVYCLQHGTTNCEEPWCWKCNNHQMDTFDRCADPRCRATNTPEARAIVETLKARWGGPVPLEVITVDLGTMLTSPSFSPVGQPEAGAHDPARLRDRT